MMKKYFILVVAALMLVATPVMAKEGFYLGAYMPNSSIDGDAGSETNSGTGWGLRAGVGFSRYVALEANYSVTKHDVTSLGTGDLKGLAGDLKLNFPLTSLDSAQVMTVEPYLVLGYTHYEFNKPKTVKSDGIQYGFGVELYLFRELSINAGWTRSEVSWNKTPNADGNIKTVDFGIIYHFI